jgi:hypothetical protein
VHFFESYKHQEDTIKKADTTDVHAMFLALGSCEKKNI